MFKPDLVTVASINIFLIIMVILRPLACFWITKFKVK